ncbi:histidine kinase [Teredinibacter turnerae T7901]|uniref:histidine kinase n=1 Tax=Teredinibacter turnerae (strain ATCC 39867 / T7901) TaxID=377629 RepID=C5BS25_TERTT|nr:response regulator [Teredinibacter turnerae]ACR13107.1 histidine kinase [Teredinibacter turnerae T7901]
MPMLKKYRRVLLVEDDEDDFILTRDLLDEFMDATYTLDWVKNYEEAKERMLKDEHDLCLMDYKLGAYDGIQLLKEVVVHDVSFPIIMLTGVEDTSLDHIALQAGAADYLVKADLSVETIARAVRYALARRETERERMERLRAESASRAKTEFLTRLSHELRTPLTAILGYTDLLSTRSKDEADQEYLQIVSHNGKHLLALLNDVLDLSKIEAGKLEIEKSFFEIQPFFSDIYLLFNMKAKDKGLDFEVRLTGELRPVFYGDATRLRQIVLNLIGNAIKFTSQGSVIVEVSSIVENVGEEQQLRICVHDTGPGISSEQLDDIFLPFNQAASKSEASENGTGLGLTISRELVSRMGGQLTVESTLGVGSCFCCTLPHEKIDGQPAQILRIDTHSPAPSNESVRYYSGNVLVVDDLADIRSLVGHMVADSGVTIEYAENGLQAVEMATARQLSGEPFDLILMDIQMPVLGGIEAAKRMRAAGLRQPIIALTASSMKGDREKCLKAGFSDFLGKPVERRLLERSLARWLPDSLLEPLSSSEDFTDVEPGTVLIVEDDPHACEITALLIEQEGWKADQALSGKEALNKVAHQQYDAVLFDINLPDTSGYKLAKEIYKNNSEVKLIALSGEEVDEDKFISVPLLHSILKPVNRDILKNALERIHQSSLG